MSADLVTRDATDADRPVLVEMMAALQDFEREIEPNRLPGAECAADHVVALLEWVRETGGGALIAGAGDREVVGFLIYGIETEFGRFVLPENQRVGQLSDLYVVPKFRRTGVGRRLIDAALERLARAGVRRVEVSALVANPDAIAAYEATGFGASHLTLSRSLA